MKRRLFGCLMQPERPTSHKENGIYFNAIILNSDEVFLQVGEHHHDEFRSKMRKLFTNVKGEQLHYAVRELHKILAEYPGIAPLSNAIMNTAQSAASLDGVADDEEMILLRDRWLRRVNNSPSDSEMSESEASANSTTASGFITLPVFIATNRQKVGGHVKKFFGTGRAPDVSWACMWLSLPDDLRYGETDCPTWRYSSKRSGAPRNKIVHLTTVPLEESCVYRMGEVMRDLGEKECVLFTHGYNTTLANACKRMAQVAYTGNFRGPSLVFSWPSNESMASYTADEANVMWAVPDFMKTLHFVRTQLGMEKVHLLAHSMGSRLALYSLLRTHPEDTPPGTAAIGRVVLAAPDFDMGEFMYLAEEITQRCERLTLYCSAEDQALHLSRSLHGGYPRLGDFRGFAEMAKNPRMKALDNMDAIDTTGTDNGWLRHAYVFEACGIILDCCLVLRAGLPPHERNNLVLARMASGHVYWTFDFSTTAGQVKTCLIKASAEHFLKLGSRFKFLTMKMTVNGKVVLESMPQKALEGDGGADETEVLESEPSNGDKVPEGGPLEEEEGSQAEAEDRVDGMASFPLRPQFSRSLTRKFMDEFATDLASPSVGGTLLVQDEKAEEVGGSDVRLPSDAEIALNLDAKTFNRTFSRSKSVAVKATKGPMSRSLSLGGLRFKQQVHFGGPEP